MNFPKFSVSAAGTVRRARIWSGKSVEIVEFFSPGCREVIVGFSGARDPTHSATMDTVESNKVRAFFFWVEHKAKVR